MNIRSSIFNGTPQAKGLYIPTHINSEQEVRGRILENWQPGALVYRIAGGYCLLFPHPLMLRSDAVYGQLLVEAAGALSSVPLSAAEKKRLKPAPGSVILVERGAAECYALTPDKKVAVGSWLDISLYADCPATTLGEPPAPDPPETPSRPMEPHDILSSETPADDPGDENLPGGTGKKKGDGIFSRLSEKGRKLFSRSSRSREQDSQSPQKSTGKSRAAGSRTGRDSAAQNTGPNYFKRMFDRFMTETGASTLYQRQHARFVAHMTRLFQQRQWTEALSHGIPLSRGKGASRPVLRFLKRRGIVGTGSVFNRFSGGIAMETDLYNHLYQMYTRSFEMLDREGNVERAAYILDILLEQHERAATYLESRGKFKQAAQLAETRNLDPALTARLWLAAGDIPKALGIAMNHKVFLPVLNYLEEKDKKAAEKWRFFWARDLANTGDYAMAVEVSRPLPFVRHLSKKWIELALDTGGTMKSRVLAFSLQMCPERFEETAKSVLHLLTETNDTAASDRRSFIEFLLRAEPTPHVRVMARETFRAMAADIGRGDCVWAKKQLRKMAALSGGGALEAEIDFQTNTPRLTSRKKGPSPDNPINVCITDRGTTPIRDAVVLENNRVLVALGETGIIVMGSDGKQLFFSSLPADDIVLSDHENLALGIIKRDDVYSVSKIDLGLRTANFWRHCSFHAFARRYSGSSWFVGDGRELLKLNMYSENYSALWHVPDLPGEISTISYSPRELHVVLLDKDWQHWHYELPGLRLDSLHTPYCGSYEYTDVSADGNYFQWDQEHSPDLTLNTAFWRLGGGLPNTRDFENCRIKGIPVSMGKWFVVPLERENPEVTVVELLQVPGMVFCGRLEFPGTVRLSAHGSFLTIIMEAGIVYQLNMETGIFREVFRT
ncbi:MAG: hypothetical protein GY765_10170 [bacterium]|nr:hypothetical protein [bacterium]